MTSRDRQREETRRRVYKAALEIFRRDGVDDSRIEDIANLAGVSRGTFYFHFPTKEDVLINLIRDKEEDMAAAVESMSPDTPLAEVLEQIVVHIASEWEDEPNLLVEIGMVVLSMTARGAPTDRDSHPTRVHLVPFFAAAMERGEVADTLPPPALTDYFMINMFGGALTWCGNPIMPLETMLKAVVQFFLRAVRPEDD